MPYQILPESRRSIECLAEWHRRIGDTLGYNRIVTRFNLGLPLLGYEVMPPLTRHKDML